MTDDDDDLWRNQFERLAGPRPDLASAKTRLATQVRRAHRRRAAVRTAAGAVSVLAVVALAQFVGGGSDDSRVEVLGPPDTGAATLPGPISTLGPAPGTTTVAVTPTAAETSTAPAVSVTSVPPATATPSTSAATPPTSAATPPTSATALPTNPAGPSTSAPTSTAGATSQSFGLTPATVTVLYRTGPTAITVTDVQTKPGWILFKQEGDGGSSVELRFRNGNQVLKVDIEFEHGALRATEEVED